MFTVTNSILSIGGAFSNCAGAIADGGYNISSDGSCGFGTSTGAEGQTLGDNVDAKLGMLGFVGGPTISAAGPIPFLTLQSDSPAIDAIPFAHSCPATDQRLFPRPDPEDSTPVCDVGAYESSPAITVNTVSDTPQNGFCTLREAMLNVANSGTDVTGGHCSLDYGSGVINFSVSGTIELNSELPMVGTSEVETSVATTIDGSGQKISIDGGDAVQLFRLGDYGELSLNNLTLQHGYNGTAGGGAIFDGGFVLNITNCTIAGNTAKQGGAIYFGPFFTNSTVSVTNSTFRGNQSLAEGSVFYEQTGSAVFTNVTIAGNDTPFNAQGRAIYIAATAGSSDVTFANSILSDNAGSFANCQNAGNFSTLTDGGYNISDDSSCGFGNTTGGTPHTVGDNVNPLLDPAGLKDNGGPTRTIALQSISPAIDDIPLASCPAADQRGAPRPDPDSPAETRCDIGAYESGNILPTPTATATATQTSTASPSATMTATATATMTSTQTATATLTATATATATRTATATATATLTATATQTATPTATATLAPGAINLVSTTSSTTATLTIPAGVQNGDLMLAFYSYWSFASATAPAGWTVLHTSTQTGSGVIRVWYRIASNDTPGSTRTWTFSGPGPYEAGGIVAYRGAAGAAFEDGFCTDHGNNAAPNLCSFTNTMSNDVYAAFYSTENINLQLPVDLNGQLINQYLNGSHFGVAAAAKNLGAPGLISSDLGAMNSGGWATIAFAIKPAPPPTTTATATLSATPTTTATATTTPTATATVAMVTLVNSTSTTSNVQTVPAGVQNGDLLFAFYSYWTLANANPPAGWTLLHTALQNGSGVETVWYRFASGNAPGSTFTWNFTGSGPYAAGGMLALRGTAAAFEDGFCTNNGNNASPTLCGFTTAHSNDLYLGFYSTEKTGLVLPGDLTSIMLNQYVFGSHFGVAAARKSLGAPGMVPAEVGSMLSGGWATIAIAVKTP